MSGEQNPLPFTGERFTPECVREIWYEHWHRYAFARPLAAGKRVLDAACGEGYGSALLADVAADVIGVDVDEATIGHARMRYGAKPRLRYERADATNLPFADKSFDVIVSFETLEHLAAQEELLAGFARVLADDGVLVISSPDKRTYSEAAGFRNEFHVRELYREELLALLKPHFPHIRLYGQKLLFQSVLWTLDGASGRSETWTAEQEGAIAAGLGYEPIYYVAVCTRGELPPDLPEHSFFGDRREAVYEHYNHEIRKNMGAGARIAELEAELARLKTQVEESRSPQATAPRRAWPWWRGKRPNE
ncbi:class I SAM-dependent methyltransferase [Dokdonella ginsengisoli]|uniref:Class I SAM-dependent methyltransferase n=1 Tax=Dokdonella ginsengisoli TaxID=363846 RepID=A0ABV9QQ50_9GAMM